MKNFLIFLLVLGLATPIQAQAPAPPAAQDAPPLQTTDQLDQLLGPIALYPDSLIALILPASTVPNDIAQAAQFVSNNGDPSQIDSQPWDPSVKGLARYPDVLNWLNQNTDWTAELGQAFLYQPADVMNAIQQLRAEAKAQGNLVDTPQQQVETDDAGNIEIDPTDPNAMYVPEYDPDDVYDEPYSPDIGPLIAFGPAYGVGPWLTFGFDWQRRGIYTGNWHGGGWDFRGRGGYGGGNPNIANPRPWHPDANRVYAQRRPWTGSTTPGVVSHPVPLPGAKIPHGNPALRTGRLTTTGPNTPNTQRDFTGWGGTRGHAPTAVVPSAPPRGTVFHDYSRGTAANEASIRGQQSRGINTQPAPAFHPPTELPASRPVPPPLRPPEFHPAPAPPPARPAAQSTNAFRGVSNGATANEFSQRGQQSRGSGGGNGGAANNGLQQQGRGR